MRVFVSFRKYPFINVWARGSWYDKWRICKCSLKASISGAADEHRTKRMHPSQALEIGTASSNRGYCWTFAIQLDLKVVIPWTLCYLSSPCYARLTPRHFVLAIETNTGCRFLTSGRSIARDSRSAMYLTEFTAKSPQQRRSIYQNDRQWAAQHSNLGCSIE